MQDQKIDYPDFGLDDRVAAVTGSSRGMGKWMALALARAGAHVAVTFRKEADKAEEVAQAIRDMGVKAKVIRLDSGDIESIRGMGREIADEFGRLDIMVNNAGVNIMKPALEVTPEDFDAITSVDLRGVYFCCQTAAKLMMASGGGKIINISSAAAFLVRKGIPISVYAAAKAGIVMLTKALAAEWAEYNINVNAIAPGYFETPLTAGRLKDPDFMQNVKDFTPLGRVGAAKDIMSCVLFLAGNGADFITGQTLSVDGGRTVL
jgi:2-deoxy-D-gluconate 3-dehydrogenase